MSNSVTNSVKRDDLDFCWSQVLESDKWFQLHFALASKSVSEAVLALHALFAMLERATHMSEESLALAQLAWWQAELSPDTAQRSAHPVVRALRDSGALHNLPQTVRDGLVGQALELAQRARPGSVQDLKALCNRVGAPRVQAELSLVCKGRIGEGLNGHCAAAGLSSLLVNSLNFGAGLWFVPLSLQARLQSDAQSLERPTGVGRAAMNELLDLGQEWFADQMQTILEVTAKQQVPSAALQHPFAWTVTQQHRLQRTIASLKEGNSEPGRWRMRDFIRIWRQCRRLSKSAGEV